MLMLFILYQYIIAILYMIAPLVNEKKIFNTIKKQELNLAHWIPVLMGIGICVYFGLLNEPSLAISISIFTATLLLSIVFKNIVFYAILSISIGFLSANVRTFLITDHMLKEKINKTISFDATIVSCEKTDHGYLFIVEKANHPECKHLKKLELFYSSQLSQNIKSQLVPGAIINVSAFVYPFYSQTFPEAFDIRKKKFFENISARGKILHMPSLVKPAKDFSINRIRQSIDRCIEKLLTHKIASVCKALITGNKTEISQEIRSNFANSGIAHILAISGLHIGIIALFIMVFFRFVLCFIPYISTHYDTKKIAAIFSWCAVLVYLYISGQSIPSVRAFIMQSIIIAAILINKTAISMKSVAIGAIFIELFTPEAILFPSFQMSFGAVISIIAFYEKFRNIDKFKKMLFGVFATTIVASIPSSLFSIASFNQVTLNSIIANILAIPLMSFFIMPIAVIALALYPIGACDIFMKLMGYGVELLLKIAKYSASLPGSYFVMPTPSDITVYICIFSGLFICLIHARVRILGLFGILIGLISYYFDPVPDIFISKNLESIAVRNQNEIVYFSYDMRNFFIKTWAKSVGCDKIKNLFDQNDILSKLGYKEFCVNIKKHKIIINDQFIHSITSLPALLYVSDNGTINIKTIINHNRKWS